MDWLERSEQIERVPKRPAEQDRAAWEAFERILHSAFESYTRTGKAGAWFTLPPHQSDDDVTVAVYMRTLEAKVKTVPSLVALVLNARTALSRMVDLARDYMPEENEFAESVEFWLDLADLVQLDDGEMKRYVDAGAPTMWMLPEQKE